MDLNFAKEINGKPTNYVEKILFGIFLTHKMSHLILKKINIKVTKFKIHSISKDAKNYWRSGRVIDFMQWEGKPYHSENISFWCEHCISVQRIEIKNSGGNQNVYVDGKFLDLIEIDLLAANEGFDYLKDFESYFTDTHFEGKIIHWTDFKY